MTFVITFVQHMAFTVSIMQRMTHRVIQWYKVLRLQLYKKIKKMYTLLNAQNMCLVISSTFIVFSHISNILFQKWYDMLLTFLNLVYGEFLVLDVAPWLSPFC